MFVTFQLEEGSIYVVYELEPVPDAIVEEGETNDLATVSDFLQFKVSIQQLLALHGPRNQ